MAACLCKVCGRPTRYGNLYCTMACVTAAETRRAAHADELRAAGFVQHAGTPNMFVKGGVAVSLDRALRIGVAQTVLHHGHAVEALEKR